MSALQVLFFVLRYQYTIKQPAREDGQKKYKLFFKNHGIKYNKSITIRHCHGKILDTSRLTFLSWPPLASNFPSEEKWQQTTLLLLARTAFTSLNEKPATKGYSCQNMPQCIILDKLGSQQISKLTNHTYRLECTTFMFFANKKHHKLT